MLVFTHANTSNIDSMVVNTKVTQRTSVICPSVKLKNVQLPWNSSSAVCPGSNVFTAVNILSPSDDQREPHTRVKCTKFN